MHSPTCIWHRARSSAITTGPRPRDRKSTRLNSSHLVISYAVFCLKKKNVHPDAMLCEPVLAYQDGLPIGHVPGDMECGLDNDIAFLRLDDRAARHWPLMGTRDLVV